MMKWMARFAATGIVILLSVATWEVAAPDPAQAEIPLRPADIEWAPPSWHPDPEAISVIGEIEGRNILLVDDLTETAGTLVNAAALLKSRGAGQIRA